ncbi:TniQ family protein [Streptomyces sp. NPDC002611]
MTNPRNREHDRAVRQYKRAHPGITMDQARAAVAARSGRQPGLPARIPAAPLPRPAERLEGYIQRVAAATGVQRHRAMELLGLAPGTSATERLDELAAGPLPDHAVQALTAATGMTADQARALTAPRTTAGQAPDLENLARRLLEDKHIRPGGTGKTRTHAGDLARLLTETYGPRVLPVDLPVHELFPAPYTPVFVDLDWPADATRPPIDPEVFDEVATALGIGQNTDTDTPPHK